MSNGGPRDQRHNGPAPSAACELDLATPNVARIYDYYLGGKDNYASDREVARMVLRASQLPTFHWRHWKTGSF